MSVNGSAQIDAGGNATLTLKNDSTVKGFRIDVLSVSVANETLDGECRIYRGLETADSLLTISGIARSDQANGPYWLAPGGALTVVFSGLTPGNVAYVNTTGYQSDGLQQGALKFENPPAVDVGPVRVTVEGDSYSKAVRVAGTNDIAVPNNDSFVTNLSTLFTGVWRLQNLLINIPPIPGATGGVHRIQFLWDQNEVLTVQRFIMALECPANQTIVWDGYAPGSASTFQQPVPARFADPDVGLMMVQRQIQSVISDTSGVNPQWRYVTAATGVGVTDVPANTVEVIGYWQRLI